MSRDGRRLATVTLSAKNQITLPRAVLAEINVKPGDRVAMIARRGGLDLRRHGPSIVEQTAGSLAPYARRRR